MIKSIDRYQVIRELGRGGMAIVYLGYDPRVGREIAIKMMQGQLLGNQSNYRRFNLEVKVVAALEHPNIVPIYDYGYFEEQPYLVMRYMAGGSLAGRLLNNPLTLSETMTVMQRIGEALDDTHRRGIIHRDLKPANVLLDQYGKTFLSDFGIVKAIDTGDVPTDPETLTGTPSYMSPEQIQGKRILDRRSDIYSVGAMLFELLSGRRPFVAEGGLAVALKHITDPVPDIRECVPDLPDVVNDVIRRAMAKLPEDRYETVGALVDDLAGIAGESPLSLVIDVPQPLVHDMLLDSPLTIPMDSQEISGAQSAARSLRKHRKLVIVSVVGAAALCGVAVVAALGLGSMNGAIAKGDNPATSQPLERPVDSAPGGGSGKLAFVTQGDELPDIFLLDTGSRSIDRLQTSVPRKTDPSWSPDGKSLLFLSQVDGQHAIYSMSADGTGQTMLLQDSASLYSPVWSPDASQIAFASKRDGNMDIYVMSADGSNVHRVSDGASQNWKPSWSPDGTKIVFYSGHDGDYNIYMMDADGGNMTALTSDRAQDYDPEWSPDGKTILFVSERDGNPEIYVMSIDGSDQVRLTNNEAADLSPVWSPDGSLIAFVSRRDGKAEIYLMNADGSRQYRVTNSAPDNLSPAWQPEPADD